MRNLKSKSGLLVLAVLAILFTGCKKKEVPVVTTSDITLITASTATTGGNVTDDGNRDVTARGVCYGTTTKPDLTDSKTTNGKGKGSFVSPLTGLTGGTLYYVRAYATNSEGTSYGAEKTFTTLGQAPAAVTSDATALTVNGATLNGTANANYLSTQVSFDYGTTTSYGSNAAATPASVTGNTVTNVSTSITGLLPGTTYHFRTKTVNTLGTAYGVDKTFTTLGSAPAAVTSAATDLQVTTATLNGTVNANLVSTTVTFEYGLSTSYGGTINATPATVTGSTVTNVSAAVTGLNPGSTYHFRVKAVNSVGTTNGTDMTFVTGGQAPTATTSPATNVLAEGATVNGSVNANLVSTTVTFEYGPTTGYGSVATATPATVTGNSTTPVNANITGLNPGAVYHFRVKAENSVGTTYGTDRTFTTLGDIPLALTEDPADIQTTSATLKGTILPYDLPTVVTFEYGQTLSYGSTITASESPVNGSDPVSASASVTGLAPGTTYFYRVKAVNILGTSNGDPVEFMTTAK